MNETNLTETEIAVLKAMHTRAIYKPNHKKVEIIMRSGFPSDQRGNVKKAIKTLIKKRFIMWYNRSKDAIQLNKEKSQEIIKILTP